MDAKDLSKILKYTLLGGGVGAGAVSLLVAARMLNESERKRGVDKKLRNISSPYTEVEIDPEYILRKSEDLDNTTIKPLRKSLKKVAGVLDYIFGTPGKDTVTDTLKWLGAIGGGLAGGYGVKKLFDTVRESELSDELKDAKKQYFSTLYMRKALADADKSGEIKRRSEKKDDGSKSDEGIYRYASTEDGIEKQAGLVSNTLGLGAAGILAYGLLRTLSAAKKVLDERKAYNYDLYGNDVSPIGLASPKLKFVVSDDDNTLGDEEEDVKDDGKKTASAKTVSESKFMSMLDFDKIFKSETDESVIKLAYELSKQSLVGSGVDDVVDAVALGYIDPLESESEDSSGIYAKAGDFCGNTRKIASEAQKALAVTYIVHSPVLREAVLPVAAGEVLEHGEVFKKSAYELLDNPQFVNDAMYVVGLDNLREKAEALKPLAKKYAASDFSEDDLKFVSKTASDKSGPSLSYICRQAIRGILTDGAE